MKLSSHNNFFYLYVNEMKKMKVKMLTIILILEVLIIFF